MSQDFGIDNAGQGFDFDDGDETDLDTLLDISNQGAEEEDDDDSVLFFNNEKAKEETRKSSKEPQSKFEEEESEEEDLEIYIDESPSESKTEEVITETYSEPETEEIVTPDSYETSSYQQEAETVEEPEIVPEFREEAPAPPQEPVERYEQAPNIRRVTIKSEAEEVGEISKIIKVLDTYRKLNSDIKNVVAQFVDCEDMNDESTLVVKVLRADPMLSQTMAALRDSASQNDRVERVFYILRLGEKLLYNLGSLVETLQEENIKNKEDKIEYSKNVEEAINNLDKKIIDYVSATQSVLSAAEDEE